MRFWIDILDASHNVLGDGPITSAVSCTATWRVNRVGEFSFQMPATDPRASLIVARRLALIYVIRGDRKDFLGGGPIDKTVMRMSNSGAPMLQVSGGDMLEELTRYSVGALDLNSTGDANITTLLGLVDGISISWTVLQEMSTPNFVARLVYETILNSLISIAEKTGCYFHLDTANIPATTLHWFHTVNSNNMLATMHGDPIEIENNPDVCLITDIEVDQDSNDLKSRAYLFGAGEGATVLTAYYASQWPDGSAITGPYNPPGAQFVLNKAGNYIDSVITGSTYGRDEVALAFKDIAPLTNWPPDLVLACNYLVQAGVQYLLNNSQPYQSYKLTVAGLSRRLFVGESIQVAARRYRDGQKPIDINTTLFILEVKESIDTDGITTTALTVSNLPRWPVNDGELIARELAKTTVMSAHPQTGPNVDTISYREHVDATHQATLYFWLGNETTTVQSVFVRLHVDPLRSTVNTVSGDSTSAGASTTSTTPSGGGATSTLANSGYTINHGHSLDFNEAAAPVGGAVYYSKSSPTTGTLYVINGGSSGISGGATELTNTDHTHNTPNHQHNIDHTHNFTPLMHPVYGVFDAGPAITYAATDLQWKTKADSSWTPITSANALSGSAGWYGIDITGRIAANALPTTPDNDVEFQVIPANVVAGKSAQLTVQIERRTSIQSIAVF